VTVSWTEVARFLAGAAAGKAKDRPMCSVKRGGEACPGHKRRGCVEVAGPLKAGLNISALMSITPQLAGSSGWAKRLANIAGKPRAPIGLQIQAHLGQRDISE